MTKLTYVEKLLEQHRKRPSKIVRVKAQLDLIDAAKAGEATARAFAKLDEEIKRTIKDGGAR
jgi:hypothetical protein